MSRGDAWDEASTKEALLAVLRYNEIPHEEGGEGIHFAFYEGGCTWTVICRFTPGTIVIYAVYPFAFGDDGMHRVNAINERLVDGCVFVTNSTVILRSSVTLFDAYSAHEQITTALECNASAVKSYWKSLKG